MKLVRKFAAGLLLTCVIVYSLSITSYAADGVIFFTDLETTVGETFTITGTVKSYDEDLSEVTLNMSYDPAYIRFADGIGVVDQGNGTLMFTGTGDSDRIDFDMQFQALQEGQIRMELTEAAVSVVSGAVLSCDLGYSDITIGEGDPSLIDEPTDQGPQIIIGNVYYSLSEAFSDADLPRGFVSGTVTYSGAQYKGAVMENGDLRLGYLTDASQVGKFFILNEQEGDFEPFEQVLVSDVSFIILLQDSNDITLPEGYEKVNVNVNENQFPAWQDMKNDGFYLMYAVNADGEKGMYRYDQKEGTYQRFTVETVEEEEKEAANGLFGKISEYLKDHIDYFILGVALIIFLFLVLLIILAVKLHNRNVELDDLYDEYGIDLEGQRPEARTAERQVEKSGAFAEDDFDAFDDGEYENGEDEDADYDEDEDGGYYDDDEDTDYYDDDEDAEEDEDADYYDDEDEDGGYYDDDEEYESYENLDVDRTGSLSLRDRKKAGNREEDKSEEFDLEFIDLD